MTSVSRHFFQSEHQSRRKESSSGVVMLIKNKKLQTYCGRGGCGRRNERLRALTGILRQSLQALSVVYRDIDVCKDAENALVGACLAS